jgi:hypothetical protein
VKFKLGRLSRTETRSQFEFLHANRRYLWPRSSSDLAPHCLARVHQLELDGRNSKNRDHCRLNSSLPHAVIVRCARDSLDISDLRLSGVCLAATLALHASRSSFAPSPSSKNLGGEVTELLPKMATPLLDGLAAARTHLLHCGRSLATSLATALSANAGSRPRRRPAQRFSEDPGTLAREPLPGSGSSFHFGPTAWSALQRRSAQMRTRGGKVDQAHLHRATI